MDGGGAGQIRLVFIEKLMSYFVIDSWRMKMLS